MSGYDRFLLLFLCFLPLYAFLLKAYFDYNYLWTIIILLVLPVFHKVYSAGTNIRFSKHTKYYLFYVLVIIVSDILRNPDFGTARYTYLNFSVLTLLAMVYADLSSISQEALAKSIKFMTFVFIASVVVITVQQLFDQFFYVPLQWEETLGKLQLSDIESRLPSIYAWLGYQSLGLSFVPISGLLIGESILRRKYKYAGILFAFTLYVGFLSKARWVFIFALIVGIQLFLLKNRKFKGLQVFISLFVAVVIVINFIQYLGIDIESIINVRFFENYRGLEKSSWAARSNNYEFIFENALEYVTFGVGSYLSENLRISMGREDILIGILDPFIKYGIFAWYLFMVSLFYLIKESIAVYKHVGNASFLFIFLGFIVVNMSLNVPILFDMGMIITLIHLNYYKNKILPKSFGDVQIEKF